MKLDMSVAPEIARLAEIQAPVLTPPAAVLPAWPSRAAGPAPAGAASVGQESAGSASVGQESAGSASVGLGSAGPASAGSALNGGPAGDRPATVGYLAGCLRRLVADPQAWWGLVRFDPRHPVRVAVPARANGCESWLLILPPGYRGDGPAGGGLAGGGQACDGGWQVACVIAGEPAMAGRGRESQLRPLLPGLVRVSGSGQPGRMINVGLGYAIILHARSPRA